jgi:hypothetical protein
VLLYGMPHMRSSAGGAIGGPLNSVLLASGLRDAKAIANRFGGATVSFLGFVYINERTGLTLIVPYWFLLLGSALAPGRWLWLRARDRRRLSGNKCGQCGYDLRASPERCPECGTTATTPS